FPLRVQIEVADLFLANHALRVELADAAALGAGRRVDHRVDEGRLAGVHGRVDGALELVGRCRLGADAAECFRDLVVARALDEDGRGGGPTARGTGVWGPVNAVVFGGGAFSPQAVAADPF